MRKNRAWLLGRALILAVGITTAGMLAGAGIAATDNGRIVYEGFDEATGNSDIYTVDPAGTDVQRLTSDGASKGHPDWSPDGTAISFESVGYESGSCCSRNIYAIDADGSDRRRLTETPDVGVGENFDATWAPDGTWLAFVSTRGDSSGSGAGDRELYLMNADGDGETQLTSTDARTSDQQPAISPDGSKIAFASDRANSGSDELLDIYTTNVDGSGVDRLTSDGAYGYPLSSRSKAPAWSPDGSRIAYESTRTGDAEIWVMDADGSDAVNVSDSPGADTEPAWSPDGTQITFTSTRSGREDVWAVDAPAATSAVSLRAAIGPATAVAASEPVNLTEGQTLAARSPDWGTTPTIGRPACTMQGTNRSEALVGTPGRDVICGRAGDDRIRGAEGDDVIRGGWGQDTIFGDAGDDRIEGGPDADELYGRHGADLLVSRDGVSGNDLLDGGKQIDSRASDPAERSVVAIP